ncbi:MAG: hypothetical protein U1F59_00405 [Candidatus Competibacteraceae bacterium]
MNDQNPTTPPEPSATGRADSPFGPRPRDQDLDSAFERLVGDRPTDRDRAMLYRVRDLLGIGPNDALWSVLFALQHYYSLYERFPAMIRAAASELLVECKTGTDQALASAEQQLWRTAREQTHAAVLEVTRSGEEVKTWLEQAIQQAARRIALKAGLAARWPWVFGGAAGMALVLALAISVALGFGRQQGYYQGYIEGQRTATTAPPDRSSDRAPSPPARGR